MKRKFIIGIMLFFFLSFIILYFFSSEQHLSVLSFQRFYNGNKIENILTWSTIDNVKEYEVVVYDKDQNVTLNITTTEESLDIQDSIFMLNDRFFVTVTAKTTQGEKITSEQYGTIWKQEINKVSKVTSSREEGKVRGRKKITLKTASPNATIYYTTDGSIPTTDSIEYEDPITLKKSMTIKAIAVKADFEDSDVSTFTYEVTSTKPIVYLSPSTQEYNIGIKGSHYTTEEEMMNKIADVIEPILKKNDIEVYRNKPSMTAATSIADSRKHDVDLHLAIHSNASPENKRGRYTGVETWIYDETCKEAEQIAEKLQAAVVSLYYSQYGNRGVLYSKEIGGLKETNPYNVNNGILLEIAFHDNWNDAVWMVENIENIGRTIANTIIDYYK